MTGTLEISRPNMRAISEIAASATRFLPVWERDIEAFRKMVSGRFW